MDETLLTSSFKIVLNKVRSITPKAIFILGTGWQIPIEKMDIQKVVKYEEVPALGSPRVEGHKGQIIFAKKNGIEMVFFMGRRHFYETKKWESVAFPIYLAKKLGAKFAVLTNSAGGISKKNKPGSFMLIKDHINAFWDNPLLGEENIFRKHTFVDQTEVYNDRLRQIIFRKARAAKLQVQEGVYLATVGGCYETPAEVRAFKKWGADAVGSSTVPEAMLASACGIKVVAISFISNYAAGIIRKKLSHNEIKKFGDLNKENMLKLLEIVIEEVLVKNDEGF